MKIQNALPVFIALCLSSTALPFHTPIEGEKGAVLKVITRWDGSSSCTGRARLKWDDMTLGWYNNLTKSGVAGHGSKLRKLRYPVSFLSYASFFGRPTVHTVDCNI